MKSTENVVKVENVSFYYYTPLKAPVFKNIKTPFHRLQLVKTEALSNVSLNIQKGRVTALLGKNGSGKTTLIKLITGARIPHKGSVHVFDKRPDEIKSKIGLCLGSTLIYYRLTARDNLVYFGKLYNVDNLSKRINTLGEMLGLSDKLDHVVESFSFGMKAKLALARALIHSPELLILDEPTLGIDLQLASQIREFISSLNCTVLLTTHYMEEAEFLADDLVLINNGRIMDAGEKHQVLNKYSVSSVPEAFSLAMTHPPPPEINQ